MRIANLARVAWEELGFTVTIVNEEEKFTDPVSNLVSDKTSTAGVVSVYDSVVQYCIKSAATGGAQPYDKNNMYTTFDIIGIDLQTYTNDGLVALGGFSNFMNVNGVDYVGDYNEKVSRTVIGGWSNEEYDKLIKEAYETTDASVKAEKLVAAEKLLIEEAPIIPVMFNQNFAFVSKELKKVDVDGHGNFILTKADLKLWDSENQVIER